MRLRTLKYGILTIGALLFSPVVVSAQSPTASEFSVQQKSGENTTSTEESAVSLDSVELKPTYPGGEKAMYEWLCKNIVYPPTTGDYESTKCTVSVQFVIEKDGSISEVKSVNSPRPELNEEVKRVLQIMPKWNPGSNNGKPVRVLYTLPLKFEIQ